MPKFIIPIEPKPQSRPRFRRNGGTYELADMKVYKAKIKNAVMKQAERSKITIYSTEKNKKSSLLADIAFFIYPPKRIKDVKKNANMLKTEVIRHNTKPDIDNLVKAVLDACNKTLFKDDGMISDLNSKKRYSLNPRIELEIKEIENERCFNRVQ